MDSSVEVPEPSSATEMVRADSAGSMAQLVSEFDWSSTDLGPASGWTTSLRMIVRFVLANRFPMLLWWGPNYIQIYMQRHAESAGCSAQSSRTPRRSSVNAGSRF